MRWADKKEQGNLDFRELRKVRDRLAKLGHDPGLADYVGASSNTKETTAGRRTGILSAGGVVKYLQDNFEKKDADFIKNKVKKRLRMLKDLRDPEEHGKGVPVRLSEVRDLYAEFMGIGRQPACRPAGTGPHPNPASAGMTPRDIHPLPIPAPAAYHGPMPLQPIGAGRTRKEEKTVVGARGSIHRELQRGGAPSAGRRRFERDDADR